MIPDPLPHGRTARRLTWPHLPPGLRRAIERRIGGPVAHADSQNSGFTPGFASVLTTAGGTRHFVKAASTKAQRIFADSYRTEGRRLAALPAHPHIPPLEWMIDDDWVVLGITHVEHHTPARPWDDGELAVALDALEELAVAFTPSPLPGVSSLVDDLTPMARLWHARLLPGGDFPHGFDAADLAARVDELTGATLVHSDIRDDNLLLTDDRAFVCDWNWAVTGPAWFDSLSLLISARGDGIDTDQVIAERALFRDVDPELIDVALAVLAGYFLAMSADPVPSNSPWLRSAQSWQAEVTWGWLQERRGWR